MDTLLIGITVVSVMVAVATSVVAWRAADQEKRRAAARVAALAAAAGVAQAPVAATPAASTPPWRPAKPAPPLSADPVALPSEAAASVVTLRQGFLGANAPVRESAAGRQRGLAVAAAILAVIVGGVATVRLSDTPRPATTATAAPLELLSLRHDREGGNLSVAGLVRNPPLASPVERVSAVVFLFDQQGTFITSARAPIDYVKLTGGDESPFVVKLQAPQTVTRYRVSFRTDAGTVPHLDRRGEAPIVTPAALVKP